MNFGIKGSLKQFRQHKDYNFQTLNGRFFCKISEKRNPFKFNIFIISVQLKWQTLASYMYFDINIHVQYVEFILSFQFYS